MLEVLIGLVAGLAIGWIVGAKVRVYKIEGPRRALYRVVVGHEPIE